MNSPATFHANPDDPTQPFRTVLVDWLSQRSIRAIDHGDLVTTEFESLFFVPSSVAYSVTPEEVLQGVGVGFAVYVVLPSKDEICLTVGEMVHFAPGSQSPEQALKQVVDGWCSRCVPALAYLFGRKMAGLESTIQEQSYSEGDTELVLWDGAEGQLQIRDDDAGASTLTSGDIFTMVHAVFPNFVNVSGLLSFEVSGSRNVEGLSGKVTLEVVGERLEDYSALFTETFPWAKLAPGAAFRQLYVFRRNGTKPTSEAFPDLMEAYARNFGMPKVDGDSTSRPNSNQASTPAKPWWRFW